jgi:hypothetical protein
VAFDREKPIPKIIAIKTIQGHKNSTLFNKWELGSLIELLAMETKTMVPLLVGSGIPRHRIRAVSYPVDTREVFSAG